MQERLIKLEQQVASLQAQQQLLTQSNRTSRNSSHASALAPPPSTNGKESLHFVTL
jgi:hypothetical protein